jgi:hypothetical protein
MGTLSEERTTFEYDDHDNVVAEMTECHRHEIRLDDSGAVRRDEEPSESSQSRYEYQYDARGNWIERIGSWRSEYQPDFQRSNVERRTITYREP